MKKYIVLMAVLTLVGACSTQPDRERIAQPANKDSIQEMDHKSNFFVARKGVKDGYVFIFHIMPAPEGEGFSRTNYHLMVSVEKDSRPITSLKLYAEVTHPDGSKQPRTLMMQMGDWYMSLFHPHFEQAGRHWITASFELSGKSYSSGVNYPERLMR